MIIVDTNVVSEFRKLDSGRAHTAFAQWASEQTIEDLYLTSISLMELEIGVLSMERRDRAQGEILRSWLTYRVMPAFASRIIPFTDREASLCAAFHVPDRSSYHDAMIAACAATHRAALATRNVKDFASFGLPIINPWE